MKNFFIGVFSTTFTSFLFYIFRYNLTFLINIIFSKVYPNVSGEYNYYGYSIENSSDEIFTNDLDDTVIKRKQGNKLTNQELLEWLKNGNKKVYDVIKLKQFANKVKGELIEIKKGDTKKLKSYMVKLQQVEF